jgi:putative peptide zinc metalloprotease protein
MFILPGAEDLPARYLRQGELVAYVLNVNEDKPTVRVVVSQSDVDLIRQHNKGVEIRLAERLGQTFPAVIKREVPGAVEKLPSTILGSIGGGEIAIDPRDAEGLKTLEKLFQFEIELPSTVGNVNIGGRVYLRFDHGYEPLVSRWYRSIRQLFLRRFNV